MKTRKGRKSKVLSTKKKQTDSNTDNEESYSIKTKKTIDYDLESDDQQSKRDADLRTQTTKRAHRKSARKTYEINYNDEDSNSEVEKDSPSRNKFNVDEENSNKKEGNNSKKKNEKALTKSGMEEETSNLIDENSKKDEENANKTSTEKSQRQTLKRKVQSINKALNSLEKDQENGGNGDSDFDKTKKTFNSKKRKEQDIKTIKSESGSDESDVGSSTEYEVEKLVDVYFKRDGKREFLVRWKGYSSKHDTWEPEKNLNCQELIVNFIKKCEKARAMPVREMRTSRRKTDRYVVNVEFRGRKLSGRLKHRPRKTYFEDS